MEMHEEYVYSSAGSSGDMFISMFGWLVMISLYLYFAFMMYKMAQKSGQADNAWFAFVPILNTVLLVQMAEKPLYWLLFLFIPIVNIFIFFKLWMDAARSVGQSAVWGFLMMIPFVNFVAAFVLAFNSRQVAYKYPGNPPPAPGKDRQPKQMVG
jgi:uncharacterized membrane protein YhaH (DUF805 family)